MIEQRPPQKTPDEIRAETTRKIWGMAVGMLGICIPLSAVTQSGPMLPIFVLIAAAVGTVGIWGNKDGGKSRTAALDAASKKQIAELEERLAALEAITNFEHRLLEAKYPSAAPVAAIAADTGAPSTAQPVAQSS